MKESLETLRSRQDFAQRKRGSTSSKNILHTFYHRKLGKTYFTHCSKPQIFVKYSTLIFNPIWTEDFGLKC